MKIICFGELLLRLAAPGYTKLLQKDILEVTFCGAEANVAASLANFGMDVEFISKIPNNDIGEAAIRSLRQFGVNTDKVIRDNGRMGAYYLEKGASQRPSKIIYDREYSAFALAKRTDFDWDHIFENVEWFHWTGINPALSEELVDICLQACEVAKEKNIIVSCDLNYRGKLWKPEKAQSVMTKLLKYVDVCIANEEDAEKALSIKTEKSNPENAEINKLDYTITARKISELYGCKYIATTFRKSYSASINGWSAMLYDSNTTKSYFSEDYEIQLVDRVGGGDSFAAGIIYGFQKHMALDEIIEFASASSCLKQTMEGDYNRATVEDVYNLLNNGGHGRVQR